MPDNTEKKQKIRYQKGNQAILKEDRRDLETKRA